MCFTEQWPSRDHPHFGVSAEAAATTPPLLSTQICTRCWLAWWAYGKVDTVRETAVCTVTAKQNYTPINKIGGRGVNCSHPAGLSVCPCVRLCLGDTIQTAWPFLSNLAWCCIIMSWRVMQKQNKKGCYLQVHSKGIYNQNMTVSVMVFELMVRLQLSLFRW